MSNKVLVIYHDNCADGIMSAAIARMHMPYAEFFPCNYNSYDLRGDQLIYKDEVAYLANKDIFILDFSFKYEEIIQISKYASQVTLLDHHKSAQAELEGKEFLINTLIKFDMNKSGCLLTWEHFNGDSTNQAIPAAITYVGGRDLWQHKGKPWELEAEYINYWLMSEPWSIDRTLHLINSHTVLQLALAEGKAIHTFFTAKVAEAKGHAIKSDFAMPGQVYSQATVNAPYWMASELGNQLSKSVDFACVWFMTKTGEIGCSLRSSNGTDVSAIAKLYGGGGHAAAAGFKFANMKTFMASGLL